MISSEQAAITVTEGEEIESETVKDADCQTIEFDYMFKTSRYQAPKNDFFDTNTKINTGLPSVEVLMVVFDHISSYVTRQTQSLNRFHEFIIVPIHCQQFPEYFPTG